MAATCTYSYAEDRAYIIKLQDDMERSLAKGLQGNEMSNWKICFLYPHGILKDTGAVISQAKSPIVFYF